VVLETDPGVARPRARDHTAIYLAQPNDTNKLMRLSFAEDDPAGAGSDKLVDDVVVW
jgi:hypothetical protein